MLVALRVQALERRALGGQAQRRGRERRPDDVHAVLARGLPELVVDVVPPEHDVAAEAGAARLRDRQRAPRPDLGDDHERLRLVGEQALEDGPHVVRVAREGLRRHVDAGERRVRADRLAEALAVGRVLGDQPDPLVAALDHERHEGARQHVPVRPDAHDLGVAGLRDVGRPRVADEVRRLQPVRLLDLRQRDVRVPAAEHDRAAILRDRLHDGAGAALGVALVVVDLEHDALAPDAAAAVDPGRPQPRSLEHVAACDGVARLREREDHADVGRRGGTRSHGAHEGPTAERGRGKRRDERVAPRQLFVHSIHYDAAGTWVLASQCADVSTSG